MHDPKIERRMTHRIVVVDPDRATLQTLCAFLDGFYPHTTPCTNGSALHAALKLAKPSLVVLSNRLTDIPIATVLTDLRSMHPGVAMLVIGDGENWMDAVICLELGADDFVRLPCNEREVLSRIRTLLRHRSPPLVSATVNGTQFRLGEFVLDMTQRALLRKSEVIRLHDTLLDLMALFARNPMMVMSRLWLMQQLSGQGCTLSERSVDVLVCRLRRIVEVDPANPRLIHTIRGQGYTYSPPQAASTALHATHS
ncbi:response regulator transcription factor [Caballeronia sp. LZ025]|uniref:response regulator transcription factor n=1 Tax=Caballeronia TaxID=1827195 RepID=UPI001FD62F84|nr:MULTISPECIES: response regulator transcription factor [Caballeronia]MDR5733929.1 response regulator transcription factor [Caballeronia sp. LZ025]